MQISICACTYQRYLGLERLLEGIEKQLFNTISQPTLAIIIADNEAGSRAEQICHHFSESSSIPIHYLAVHTRGISYARNACLDHIPDDTDFFAMIDDDEIPEPTWLEQLLITQARTDADVVYGPVRPVFTEAVPQWIRAGHFFETPEQSNKLIDRQLLTSAATNNCLVRANIVRQPPIRFDPAFALTGGEDKLFFWQINAAGKPIVWAAHALVKEIIPPERACFSYLFRSAFRKGNVKLSVKLRQPTNTHSTYRKVRLFIKTFFKSINGILGGTVNMFMALTDLKNRQVRLGAGAFRIADGLGILTSLFRFRFEHYK